VGTPDVPVLPLTVSKLESVAAMFKEGDYGSFDNYVSRARREHTMAGHQWTDQLRDLRADLRRSVLRGKGEAKQAGVIDLERIHEVENSDEAYVPDGPIGPRRFVEVCSAFGCREIEGSLNLASSTTLIAGKDLVELMLPASKTDPQALSERRAWGCWCEEVDMGKRDRAVCPLCATREQFALLHEKFGRSDGTLPPGLPLFPTSTGGTATKAGVTSTIEKIAEAMGEELVDRHGRRKYTAHACRVSGAQFLGQNNIDLPVIAMLFRWAGPSVLRYAARAPLKRLTSVLKRRRAEARQETEAVEDGEPAGVCPKATVKVAMSEEHMEELRRERGILKDLCAKVFEAVYDSADQLIVVNEDSDVRHRPAAYDPDNARPSEWRSLCGWKFGLGSYKVARTTDIGMVEALPLRRDSKEGPARCGTCFPGRRPRGIVHDAEKEDPEVAGEADRLEPDAEESDHSSSASSSSLPPYLPPLS